ncbi:MAG: hypothetical protein K2M89_06415 [Clostridiales bacterium]|nr:hypothetical protein [Clostridiales bacterium]
MNTIWNIVEPYVLALGSFVTGGGLIAFIAAFVCKRITNKASAAYDIQALAKQIADKLGGKTIEVDITSIVEKRLKEISNKLAAQVGKVADETNSYKPLLVCIGTALAHLKMLTDDERAALIAAVRELDKEYVPPAKEVIATIKLEPISVASPPASDNSQERSQTVNME